jgi:hypothetical protein
MEPIYNKKFMPVNKTEAKEYISRTIVADYENDP